VLARGADPGDGLLDVVVVRESERSALVAYLAERERRPETPSPFESRRARRAHLTTTGPVPLHVDDRAIACAGPLDATFSVRPHAVSFLVERQPPPEIRSG
jgi:diacylglycerol kinase family enzyme